ncbi:MAG TPA: hypothetical protein IAB70_05865 [Candidatus Merdicola faecigallinarum]|uniref:Uncharacterized protein n=1 Tax=Candidatus Merdicola faecigallinarum TaxID=2840862 RepID=A0A9D1M238_9FIRM|nr:hypothetical protein [Candidatus Merdicola faecigallinarum]
MQTKVNLYSMKKGEINHFLNLFYEKTFSLEDSLTWEKEYKNPIELADIIGSFIDNNDKFQINMWISLDEGLLINVTDDNADSIIRYLYERFPY